VKDRPVIGITIDIEGEYLRLRHQYPSAVMGAGGMPVLIPHKGDTTSVARFIDGLLISGGNDIDPSYFHELPHPSVRLTPRERTDFEITLLRSVMELRKPVLGICYGMQLINVALGGSLYQDIGSQIRGAIDHRNGRHNVRIIQSTAAHVLRPVFSGLNPEITVNSSHHQAVKGLGEGLEVFAVSEEGVIEGLFKKDYPFLVGVQWHPERVSEFERKYDKLSSGIFELFIKHAAGVPKKSGYRAGVI